VAGVAFLERTKVSPPRRMLCRALDLPHAGNPRGVFLKDRMLLAGGSDIPLANSGSTPQLTWMKVHFLQFLVVSFPSVCHSSSTKPTPIWKITQPDY
jgi:hypothetical protein